ncbi:MAG: glucosamine-6-phosphate deaminase [Terriglobia bacterium]
MVKPVATMRAGNLALNVYESRKEMGKAAAEDVARRLNALAAEHETVPVIFATGDSQRATLEALTAREDVPWDKVIGFHMDEYLGIPEDHPASFRKYLREYLTSRAPQLRFYPVMGSDPDPAKVCREYAELLGKHRPLLCLLGIGENGHLAFNDPAEADFHDPEVLKVVTLDAACRQQQVNEGWFPSLEAVPRQAITLTIPTLMRVPELFASVPGSRKAHIVRRTVEEPVSTQCPATIMRTHPNATAYLDRDSAAELTDHLRRSEGASS